MNASIEEKLGKFYTRFEELKGRVKRVEEAVFGNGHPGHEKRIQRLEEVVNKRRETCPYAKEHADKRGQKIIIISLVINGLMMISGFAAIAVTIVNKG